MKRMKTTLQVVATMSVALLIGVTIFLSGCGDNHEVQDQIVVNPVEKFDAGLFLVYDVTGSYQNKMLDDGLAWQYSLAAVHSMHKQRPRWNVRFLIGHISGSTDPIVFDGSLKKLRKQCSGPQQFRTLIKSKMTGFGSRVYDSIRTTVDDALAVPGIRQRKIPSALLVFSDMEETYAPESKERLLESLKEYAKTRSSVGLYFVANENQPVWEQHLRQAGFKDFIVRADFQDLPPLPKYR